MLYVIAATLSAATVATGCTLSLDYGGTRFQCADEICPDGYTCISGFCEMDGAGGDAGGDSAAVGLRERTISLDNSGGAAVSDLPIPIRLGTPTIDYAPFAADGSDVHFVDLTGAALPHEIESWDPAGESIVWVVVPSVDANQTGPVLTMRYGDPTRAIAEQPDAVFGAYAAAYHLGPDVDDSSPSRFHGQNVGSTITPAHIGSGRAFAGNTQYVDLGMDRPFLQAQSAFTISAWIRAVSPIAANGAVFATSIDNMGMPTNTSRAQLLVAPDSTLIATVRTAEGGPATDIVSPPVPTDSWVHVAFVVDLSTDSARLYVNGAEVASQTMLMIGSTTADSVSTQTVIGLGELFTVDPFPGSLDEVRLSHSAQGADRLAAEVASASPSFVTIGPEQLAP